MQLEWSCIDTKRRIATVHKTRGSTLQAVPLSDLAVAILKRQPRTTYSNIVFWRGKGLTIDWGRHKKLSQPQRSVTPEGS